MAGKPDPSIRLRLRDRAVDYVLTHGVTDLSLRPLAQALGTNARMLIYHFGSREELMKAILEGLREHGDRQIDHWFRGRKRPRTMAEFVRAYWRRLSSPQIRPATLLIFELYALALRDPEGFPGVLEDPVAYWKKLVERSGSAFEAGSDATATLLLALTRGLALDLAATGDRARTTRALREFLHMLEDCERKGPRRA